jgi:hypothetical protein
LIKAKITAQGIGSSIFDKVNQEPRPAVAAKDHFPMSTTIDGVGLRRLASVVPTRLAAAGRGQQRGRARCSA